MKLKKLAIIESFQKDFEANCNNSMFCHSKKDQKFAKTCQFRLSETKEPEVLHTKSKKTLSKSRYFARGTEPLTNPFQKPRGKESWSGEQEHQALRTVPNEVISQKLERKSCSSENS